MNITMTPVYLRVPDHDIVKEIARELLDDGMAKNRIHAYSVDPRQASPMPIQLIRYLTPSGAVAIGGVVGAFTGALVGLPFLSFGSLGLAPLLVLMVTCGVGGAVYRLWIGNGPGGELYQFDEALKSGEVVMVLEVDEQQMSEVERTINFRHPEVLVMGADPRGTPPFP